MIRLITFFISLTSSYLSFHLSYQIFTESKKKEKEVILSSISFLLAALFFLGHSFSIQKKFLPTIILFKELFYPSLFILHFLPFFWMLLIFIFYKDKKIFGLISNLKLFFLISASILLFSLVHQIQYFSDFKEKTIIEKLEKIPELNLYLFGASIFFSSFISIIYLFQTKLEKNSIIDLAKNKSFFRILTCSILLTILAVFISYGIFFHKSELVFEIQNLKTDFPNKLFFFDFISSSILFLILIFIGKGIVNYQIFTGSNILNKSAMQTYSYILSFILILGFVQTIGLYFYNYIDYKEIFIVFVFFIFLFRFIKFQKRMETKQKKLLNPFFFRENLRKILFQENEKLNLKESYSELVENYLQTEKSSLVIIHPIKEEKEFYSYPESNSKIDEELISFVKQKKEDLVYLKESISKDFFICIKLENESTELGYLFLGKKLNQELFTEEELELAKFGLKNLIELNELILLSKNLLDLKKEQILENRTFDNLTRRILHDEILPEIQTILIEEDSKKNKNSKFSEKLIFVHKKISNLLKQIPEYKIEINEANFFAEIKNLIRNENPDSEIFIDIKKISPLEFLNRIEIEILYYAIREFVRNISKYAKKESEKLEIEFSAIEDGNKLILELKDNGIGFNQNQEKKGSGNGILIHKALLNSIHADLEIQSKANEFSLYRIIILKEK